MNVQDEALELLEAISFRLKTLRQGEQDRLLKDIRSGLDNFLKRKEDQDRIAKREGKEDV